MATSPATRFWKFVNKSGSVHPIHGVCWEWTGHKTRGYGTFALANHRMVKAHRFSYSLHFKVEPGKMMVCHKCDNKSCVRPEHLFLGTGLDNYKDMVSKGRKVTLKGEDHPRAKLTEDDVRRIRKIYKRYDRRCGSGALARHYKVTPAIILWVVKKLIWTHVQ